MRRICESVPVSRVILRFLRISQEISQVDSTCENSVLGHIYPSHCIRVLKKVLFYFLLVLFSRIISKFFVLTIDNIHHGQTKSQHYIAGPSSEKVSRRGVDDYLIEKIFKCRICSQESKRMHCIACSQIWVFRAVIMS